jgi:hypothetical protein
MALRRNFGDQPLRVSRLPSFRAEHLPDSGPYPWLDGPDALDRIDRKLATGAVTPQEADQCRYWSAKGRSFWNA